MGSGIDKDLPNCDFVAAEALLEQTRDVFRKRGILLTKASSKSEHQESYGNNDNLQWIKEFIIPADAPAFYNSINSPEDIQQLNSMIEEKLTELQNNLKTFLLNNGDIEEPIKRKITIFASTHLVTAKKAVKFKVRNSLKKDIETCNNVEDLRNATGRIYSDFIKKELLDHIMLPLYEGIQFNFREESYHWVLQKMNQFLSDLGVMTVDVEIGKKITDEMPYQFSPENTDIKYLTDNPENKDIIQKICRYAYVFNEEKGFDNRLIMDGEVLVLVYRPGGKS